MAGIAKIVVDLALNREFDYLVPESLGGELALGSKVMVPFGRSQRVGYVVGLADKSARSDLKPVTSVVSKTPLITDTTLELARWMSDYYCAPIEHAVRTVLPGAVRRKKSGFKEMLYVTPSDSVTPDTADSLRKRSPKQAAVLESLGDGMFMAELVKASGASAQAVRALEKKDLLHIASRSSIRDPLARHTILKTQPLNLMPEQKVALEAIKAMMLPSTPAGPKDNHVILLHGVTGSGKTEVYLQAIEHVLAAGGGSIVLVPEISLTPQAVERFVGRFGETVAVLHSNLSEGERHDEWHRILDGKARIAIGARSAVFAPVKDLKLIVVDEEHDGSYKQDESPRYNARDVAVMRGVMAGCSVVLGSATPSAESYANAKSGKYSLASLPHRADHRQMPSIRVVDMRIETEREGRVNVFSRDLIDAMRDRLNKGEQTILFLNRRGFSTSVVCPKCGHVAMCNQCSVSYTYHRQTEELRCHICGGVRRVPTHCPECGDPAFKFAGIGTQRVESIVKQIFPEAGVQRMDSDVTSRKDAHWEILGDFRSGKTDILIGTQMIAKGLDFPNVTLIGVIYADLSLHVPDFRAGERTFQLLTQVSGRAGRGDVPGEVLVQTYTPFHVAVQCAQRADFEGFYEQEYEFRKELCYPPFSHLVCLTVKGTIEEKVRYAIEVFSKNLQARLPDTVMLSGPAPAPLAKAKGYYRYQLMLRSRSVRSIVGPVRAELDSFKWPPKVSCSVDVDAISLM